MKSKVSWRATEASSTVAPKKYTPFDKTAFLIWFVLGVLMGLNGCNVEDNTRGASVSIFSEIKDFIFKHPIITAIAALCIGIVNFFAIWRICFPMSWYLWRLKSRESEVHSAAIEGLAKIGFSAVLPLVKVVKTNRIYASFHAAEALSQINDPRASELLIEFLNDHDSSVCTAAAKALGRIKDIQAVEPLIKVLSDNNSSCNSRSAAANALGKIKDIRAVEPLIRVLSNVNYGPYGREYDSGASVRCAAGEALGEINDPRAVEPLIAALSDEYLESQSSFSRSFKYPVRQSAVNALGKIKDQRAVEPLIKALLLDRNEYGYKFDHESIIKALVSIDEVRAAEPIRKLIGNKDYPMKHAAVKALVQLYSRQGKSGIKPLLLLLGITGFTFFHEICYALKKMVDPRLLEPLEEAVSNIRDQSGYSVAGRLIEKLDDSQIELLTNCITEGRVFKVSYTPIKMHEVVNSDGYTLEVRYNEVDVPAKIAITPTNDLLLGIHR